MLGCVQVKVEIKEEEGAPVDKPDPDGLKKRHHKTTVKCAASSITSCVMLSARCSPDRPSAWDFEALCMGSVAAAVLGHVHGCLMTRGRRVLKSSDQPHQASACSELFGASDLSHLLQKCMHAPHTAPIAAAHTGATHDSCLGGTCSLYTNVQHE